MERVISNILKLQNQILLQKLSVEYKLDEKRIMTMYHTPTFYQVDKIPSKYQVKNASKNK